MNIAMLHDNVLLELDAPKEYSGSLHIPDNAKDAPQTATVVAVGPGRWHPDLLTERSLFVHIGDRVVFPKYAGVSVEVDGKTFISVRESELLAVVTD